MEHCKFSIQNILISFFTLIGLFLVARIFFLLDFMSNDFLERESWVEVLLVFLSATRFDISLASSIIFIPTMGLIILIPFSKRSVDIWSIISFYFLKISTYLVVFLIIVSHYYFYYYQSHFNIYFWEFWENWENSKLVIWSIYDELPMLKLIISFLGFFFFIYLFQKIFAPLVENISGLVYKKISLIIIPILILVGIRGTFDRLPLTMQRYRGQISSVFLLNMIHGNPFFELYSSWENIKGSDSTEVKTFLNLSEEKIPNWFSTFADLDNRRAFRGSNGSSYYLEYEVPALRENFLIQKPEHIVLIFMESQPSWLSSYEDAFFQQNIRQNLNKIKEKSLSFNHYFQTAGLTFNNIMLINLSIPIRKNFRNSSYSEIYKPFPMTLPRIMSKSGYKPLFFYGGSLAWHRLDEIMPKLGYQLMFGESSIQGVSKTRFGVHDESLFEMVHSQLRKAKGPTFSFVMTLSNHAPYNVPENFTSLVNSLNAPKELKEKILDEDNFNKRMRSLAYADQALGEFFYKASKSSYFKKTLFILTSDHHHAMGLKWKAYEYYHRMKIPLIFYSPLLLKTNLTNKNWGSHIDIPPTLLSLILGKSIKINSWGRSLLEKPKEKILISSNINCAESICQANGQTFILQKDQKMMLCKESECLEKSKQISKIVYSFWNSGKNYLFKYKIDE